MTNIKNAVLYRYGIFRFAQENALYFKEEIIMSKELIYPRGDELKAVINETKYQILMRMFYRKNYRFTSDISFKELQEDLNLFEVSISSNQPTLLVSKNAFMRALNLAKEDGWICLKRRHTALAGKLFEIELSPKGEKIAQKEWGIICDQN